MENLAVTYAPVTTQDCIDLTAHLAEEIWRDCYAPILTPEQLNYMLATVQSPAAIARQIHQDYYAYFIVYLGEKPVGYVGVQEKNAKLLLSKLYVRLAFQGHGLGQQGLTFAESLARQKGCNSVWLTVNRYNARAVAVYKKAGYTLVRQEDTDIGDGFLMEDFVFEKTL